MDEPGGVWQETAMRYDGLHQFSATDRSPQGRENLAIHFLVKAFELRRRMVVQRHWMPGDPAVAIR